MHCFPLPSCLSAIRRYPLTSTVVVAIWILSLMPVPEFELVEDVPLMDKWTHMVMYGGLCLTYWFERSWRLHRKRNRSLVADAYTSSDSCSWRHLSLLEIVSRLVLPFLLAVLMSGLLELLQAFCTTYRNGDWLDFVANTIGAFLGSLIGALLMCL